MLLPPHRSSSPPGLRTVAGSPGPRSALRCALARLCRRIRRPNEAVGGVLRKLPLLALPATLAASLVGGTAGCESSGGKPIDVPARGASRESAPASPRAPREATGSARRAPQGPVTAPAESRTARGGRGEARDAAAVGRDGRGRPGLDGRTPRRLDPSAGGATWSIVLGTFTGPDHAAAAKEANERLGERIPEFRGSAVRSTATGSMILWGQFPAIDDPAAQRELRRIQAYEYRGARPFAKAMLTRPEPTKKPPTGPHDLRNLRRQRPEANPLYTLQVAVWADFDGTRSLEEIRRAAEGYTGQLRSRGLDAWFHHDDDLMMSVVTVGAFGADAYNPRSTLYSDEVDALIRQFPQQLVNGERLLIRDDPRNPRSSETPLGPLLVEVPR